MAGGGGAAKPRPGDWSSTVVDGAMAKVAEAWARAMGAGSGGAAVAENGQGAPALDFCAGA